MSRHRPAVRGAIAARLADARSVLVVRYAAGPQTLFVHTCDPGHWVHAAVQFAPVVFVSATQALPHMWKPALHAYTQDVPLQVAVPFVGAAMQVVHEAPQAATVSLATQVVPRRQKPGVLQAVHDVPHELRLVFATQGPVVAGQ
jgi:hypothetical protein